MVFKQQRRAKSVQIIGDVAYSKDLVKSRSTRSRETDATSHYTEDDSVQQHTVVFRPQRNGEHTMQTSSQKVFNLDVESYHPPRTCLSFLSDNRSPRSKLSRETSSQKAKNIVDTHEPPRTCMSFLDQPNGQKSCILSPCGVPSKKPANPRVQRTFKPNRGLSNDNGSSPLLILEPEEKLKYNFVGNKDDWLSVKTPTNKQTSATKDNRNFTDKSKQEQHQYQEVDSEDEIVSFSNEATCFRQDIASQQLNFRKPTSFSCPRDSWTSDDTKEWGRNVETIAPPSSLPIQRRSQLILRQRTEPDQASRNLDWIVGGADFSLLFSENSPFSCRG